MSASITALLSGVVALMTSMGTAWWKSRTERRHRNEDQIEELLAQYREPLVRAAFDLQRRLYDTIREGFVDGDDEYADNDHVRVSTKWLVAQYFGWAEVLRREVQFLDFGSAHQNRRLVETQERVSDVFATGIGGLPSVSRIWTADQRAIGELMTVEGADGLECLGYASFLEATEHQHNRLRVLLDRLDQPLKELAEPGPQRQWAVLLQRALVDVVDFLDDDRSRFPIHLRGKLPVDRPLSVEEAQQVVLVHELPSPHADFRFDGDPWPHVLEWADAYNFELVEDDGGTARRFSHRRKDSGVMRVVDVSHQNARVVVLAHLVRPWWVINLPGLTKVPPLVPPESSGWRLRRARRRLRDDVNVLLQMFDRPLIREARARLGLPWR